MIASSARVLVNVATQFNRGRREENPRAPRLLIHASTHLLLERNEELTHELPEEKTQVRTGLTPQYVPLLLRYSRRLPASEGKSCM